MASGQRLTGNVRCQQKPFGLIDREAAPIPGDRSNQDASTHTIFDETVKTRTLPVLGGEPATCAVEGRIYRIAESGYLSTRVITVEHSYLE